MSHKQKRFSTTNLPQLALLTVCLLGCRPTPSQSVAALDSKRASVLARQLANQKAQAVYQVQPFTSSQPAQLVGDLWHWREMRAYGHADLEANVSFALDGSSPSVQVFLLNTQTIRDF